MLPTADEVDGTWRTFTSVCNPLSSSTCRAWKWLFPTVAAADVGSGWHRVAVTLPDVAMNRRYRIVTKTAGSFAISNMYVLP